MPILTPHGKHLSIQNLLAISTMMSPFHHHDRTVPRIQAGGGLAASDIPDEHFYLSNAIQDRFKVVYQEHCGGELTLSREALERFLKDTQAQPIEVPAAPATYGFEEFLQFLWTHGELDAMRAAAPKDLSRPISNYFISSSHNTYLSGNQLSSKSSTDAYKNVLLRGCRCIEIDVWNGEAPVAESVSSTSPPTKDVDHLSLLERVVSKVENKVEKAEKKLDYAKDYVEETVGFAEKGSKISTTKKPSINNTTAETTSDDTIRSHRTALDLKRTSSETTITKDLDLKKTETTEKGIKPPKTITGNGVQDGLSQDIDSKNPDIGSGNQDTLPAAENNDLHKIPSITRPDPYEDFSPPELQRATAIRPMSSTDSLVRPSSKHSVSSVGSTRPEPRVLHGWTLTSDISFRDVCKTVRDTAFVKTDLPIIVSLEVHADLEQQEIMVDIMKDEWAGYLIDEAHEACDPEERLPRLEELRNKILVKVKKAPQNLTPPQQRSDTATTNRSLAPIPTTSTGHTSDASGSEDERSSKKKKTKVKICESLSRLGIYTRSTHFTNFEQPEAKVPAHVFSVGENQILELHETRQSDLFSHNRDFFMRAYPAGRRFDSSNLDPSVFWRKGVQMVALNWQTWDEAMMLSEGMFAGENGWVLKPQGYRTLDNTTNQADAINHMTLDLKIKIFAAQHLPLPPNEDKISGFHPYIKCELHVEKAEERLGLPIEAGGKSKEGAHKQQSQTRKGVEPDWNGEEMVFNGIPDVVEELSFVRFKIQDDELYKDHLAAWACIRLDRLQRGYRFIRLFDAKGAATAGMLLVKIEKTIRP